MEKTLCKRCNSEMDKSLKICPACGAKKKMSIGKKLGIFFGIIILLGIIGSFGDDSSSSQKQEISVQSESSETPTKEIPVEENIVAEWNTKDVDAMENGNIWVAVEQLKTKNNIRSEAINADASMVIKTPWKYYGNIIAFTGIIAAIEEYSPESDMAKNLESDSASDIVIETDNGIIVEMMSSVSTGNLTEGDRVTLYGYPVGRADVENTLGGSFTHLIIVGNALDKN